MLDKEYIEQKNMMKEMKELLNTIEESDKQMQELKEEMSKEDKEFQDEENKETNTLSVDALKEEFSKIENYNNKLEINNREAYIKMLNKNLENENENIRRNASDQIKMLENLFTLERLMSKVTYGKPDNKIVKELKNRARKKLSVNKRFTFTEPSLIEKSLKQVFDDKKLINRVLFQVWNYILNTKIEQEGLYIYFLLLTLSSLHHEDMKDREIVIEKIKELF